MNKLNVINEPWYAEGLNFKCTGCGKCCTGSPGYVWVTLNEIEEIADHLQLSLDEFSQKYLRKVKGRFSLKEHPSTYDCAFLKDNKCEIYEVRPTQCRTYPWWPKNLKSKKDWQEAATYCEGISLEAPLVPIEVISEQLDIQNRCGNNPQ